MNNVRAFVAGATFTVALFLLAGVAVHFSIGVEQALNSLRDGNTSYWVVLAFLVVVIVMTGFKAATAITGLKLAVKHRDP